MPKTKRIDLYSFEELSEGSKDNAIQEWASTYRMICTNANDRTATEWEFKMQIPLKEHIFLKDGRLA